MVLSPGEEKEVEGKWAYVIMDYAPDGSGVMTYSYKKSGSIRIAVIKITPIRDGEEGTPTTVIAPKPGKQHWDWFENIEKIRIEECRGPLIPRRCSVIVSQEVG